MSEEFIIKRKLIFDGDGSGEEKKITAFLKLLPRYILSNDTNPNTEAAYNKLFAQLQSIITSRRKADIVKRSNAKQMRMFKVLQNTYESNIINLKQDIVKQKHTLHRAKIVKQNHLEYELLLKTVNHEPTRKELTQKIANLESEIEKMEKEKQHLDQKWDSKVKQCFVLSTSANTLKDILEENDIDGVKRTDTSSMNSEISEPDLIILD